MHDRFGPAHGLQLAHQWMRGGPLRCHGRHQSTANLSRPDASVNPPTMTFAGLMSRCTSPFACRQPSAFAMPLTTRRNSGTASGPSIILSRNSPPRSSIRSDGRPWYFTSSTGRAAHDGPTCLEVWRRTKRIRRPQFFSVLFFRFLFNYNAVSVTLDW